MSDMNAHNLAVDYSGQNIDKEKSEKKAERKAEGAERALREPHPFRRTASIAKYFIVAAAALALLCYMIFGRVELSSLYTEQSELETRLARLQSENVALETELAQKNGLTQAESYAENVLGLKKLEKYQIEYVEVPKPNVAEAAAPEDDNVFVRIKKWFTGILEYIGIQ